MADLKKQLILEVSLDTKKLKTEIEALKKDIKDVGATGAGFNTTGLKGLNEDLKKVRKEITALTKDIKGIGSTGAGSNTTGLKGLNEELKKVRKEITALTKDIKGIGATGADTTGLKDLRKGGPRSILDIIPGGAGISQGLGGAGRLLRGPLGIAGGAAAMLTGGAMLGSQLLSNYDEMRALRASQANTISGLARSGDFAGVSIMQNDDRLRGLLGGSMNAAAGAGKGALFGSLAFGGLGAVLGGLFGGGVGAIPGAKLGAAFGSVVGGLAGGVTSFMPGYERAQKEERERLMLETQPIRDAMARQRELSNVRRQVARRAGRSLGGANTMQRLTSLQFLGTREGFGQEETLNQMMQLGSSVGMNEAAISLPRSQYFMNRTGVDVGTQGALREAITGAERGSFAGSQEKMEAIIRRGMAFGIKDGKLDQYARITAEAVERNASLGGVQDADAIAAELASRARGLAGEGDITQGTLARAADIQSTIRDLSSQTQGVAGAGNFLAIQKAARESGINLDPAQMLLMAQASNKGGGAMKEILGRSGQFSAEQIDKFVGAATANKSNLTEMFPGLSQDMRDILGNIMFGTTERTLDVAKSGRGGMGAADAIDLEGRGTDQTGKEGDLNRIQQQVDFTAFQAGMDNINLSMREAAVTIKKYSEVIERSAKVLENRMNIIDNNNLGR